LPAGVRRGIHRLIPGSDLTVFKESSHSIRVDEPQAMLNAIVGFVVYRTSGGLHSTTLHTR
jgi:proline iminopeptidase